MNSESVRGVIDRFEGDYAVLVLDDGQQLDWPRSTLPTDAQPGVAVALSLSPIPQAGEGEAAEAPQAESGWQGELALEADHWVVRLTDGQELRWPTPAALEAQAGGTVRLQLQVDLEDTQARRQRVRDLLDDIFGPK